MKKFIPLFAAGFFFSAHLGLLAYINSTMLAQIASERSVSIVFALGSCLSLGLLFIAPQLLKRIGSVRLALITGLVGTYLLYVIGTQPQHQRLLGIFVIYFALNTLLLYCLDLFVEHYSKKNLVGNTRGIYLTLTSLGWVSMPFLAGSIATLYSITTVYLVAAFSILMSVILILIGERDFRDSTYHGLHIHHFFQKLRSVPDIRRILTINFMLQFFFAWMVVYLPFYLQTVHRFSLAQIGIIVTVMLLPFILFEYPAGKFADTHTNGEKKLIIWGLVLAGIFTIGLVLLPSSSVAVVALMLFCTRIGASIIEVTCDSYFFKRVTDSEAGLIGLYRMMLPLAYILGPLTGAVLLSFVSHQILFITLGILMLLGALYATRIPRTK